MIHKSNYPVCGYDTSRDSIIKPTDFLKKCIPEKCIITFFRKVLEDFVEENALAIIVHLHTEVLDIPFYEYKTKEETLCITMPFSTAPGAAATLEKLHAMGCNKF